MGQQSSFAEDFARASRVRTETIQAICNEAFGSGCAVRKSSAAQDKSGYDYIIALRSGQKTTADLKYRCVDPISRFGTDDIAIETVANTRTGKAGWSMDEAKVVDWILWLWPTNRWHIAPYPLLRRAAILNVDAWRREYREHAQTTNGLYGEVYQSRCLFVPTKVLARAMYEAQSGRIKSPLA